MEHPYLFFVKIFELIGLGHFAHSYPHVIYTWVVMALLIALGFLATKSISMVPAKAQNVFELIISGIEDFMIDITGEEGRWLFPVVATVFIYIFVCNLIGLVPGFFPPTASLNTTLSCALVVVVLTHIIGIKYNGPMGHELVLGILFGLAGAFFAPLPIMALGIFVALVQAFVFFLLSIMYFSGAMEHAH
jgi:F-type H+-transporting ATPase subunit a